MLNRKCRVHGASAAVEAADDEVLAFAVALLLNEERSRQFAPLDNEKHMASNKCTVADLVRLL